MNPKTRLLRRCLGLCLLGLIIGIMGTLVIQLPVFRIESISTNRVSFVDANNLENVLARFKGKNAVVVWASGGLKDALVESFCQIDSVDIALRSKALAVTITEKQPWVAFMKEKATVFAARDGALLNADGADLAIAEPQNILIIRGLSDSYFSETKIHPNAMRKIEKIVENIRYYFPETDIQVELNDAFSQSEDPQMEDQDLVVRITDTLPVKIGSLERLDVKFRTLKTFLAQPKAQSRPIAYIDLRVNGKIFVKYKGR